MCLSRPPTSFAASGRPCASPAAAGKRSVGDTKAIEVGAGLVSQRGSDMSGLCFKTAAHSSKMLTKRHRLYRLAGQLAQAREGFAVAPGPCLSGSPPLLMAAARAGLVSERGSDLIGWRFKTAVCPLLMSHLHCLTSPFCPFAINRGLEPAGHGPCATAQLSPLNVRSVTSGQGVLTSPLASGSRRENGQNGRVTAETVV